MSVSGFQRNTAGNIASAEVINAATGAGFAGAVSVYVILDGGAATLGTVAGGVATTTGNGRYQYPPSAAECDATKCEYLFVGVGAVNALAQYFTISAAQSQALQAATGTGVVPVSTIVADAFNDLNIIGSTQPADPADMAFGLGKLNVVLDNLNAAREGVYQEQFVPFTLTPSLSPHTLGPTGTWVTTQRPVSIDGGTLTIGSGITQPIDFDHDWAWYLAISQKGLSTAYPTDGYFEPDWPNGKVFLWPVPSSALVVTLAIRIALAQVTLVDTFWMPPGYRDAITKTLAEDLMFAYPRQGRDDAKLARAALLARERAFANNVSIPTLATRDAGMPRGGRGTMNYRTRQVNP